MSAKARTGNFSIRPASIKLNPLKNAEGSALITVGNTQVLCAASIEQGRPKWMAREGKSGGWVSGEYSLLPRSTNTRTMRERNRVSGRTLEIQRLIGRSLRSVVNLPALPDVTITVDCDVIQADGGTRTASVTGGYVAMYQALKKLKREKRIKDIPVLDQVAAISVGVVDGQVVLDLDYEKDHRAEVDMNVVMTGAGKLVEVQGTAEGEPFSRAQLDKMLSVAAGGIDELLALQRKVLRLK